MSLYTRISDINLDLGACLKNKKTFFQVKGALASYFTCEYVIMQRLGSLRLLFLAHSNIVPA